MATGAATKNRPGSETKPQAGQQSPDPVKNSFADAKKLRDNINSLQGGGVPFKGKKNGEKGNVAQRAKQRAKKIKEDLKEQAKEKIKKKAKDLAIKNAGETFGLSVVLYIAVFHWKEVAWTIGGIFFLLFILFSDDAQQQQGQGQGQTDPTTSETCNPTQAANGQTSVCTITVTYNGSADDIVVTSTILTGTSFVSAGQNGTYNQASNTVTWDAKQLNLALNPVNFIVTLTLRVSTTQNNVSVFNAYSIIPTNLQSTNSGSTGANLPPNSNTCSGFYLHYMSMEPSHQNYGDPNCELVKKDPNGVLISDKDAILKQLQSIKPTEAMGWWMCVIPRESDYNANAYLKASTSGFGAYGLVQMNPTGKGNGQYDNGEVNWQQQLSNGITYNDTMINHTFTYWPHGGNLDYRPCLRQYGITVN
ncbi:MAG TPA: hypothetical protein VNW29_05135 [Candidatus Sulfotelmatobacter sp.]|jgi:hypothetical protein|nr:hypothetical protein [Candidatus Sulfotelmatobacter sp.]